MIVDKLDVIHGEASRHCDKASSQEGRFFRPGCMVAFSDLICVYERGDYKGAITIVLIVQSGGDCTAHGPEVNSIS